MVGVGARTICVVTLVEVMAGSVEGTCPSGGLMGLQAEKRIVPQTMTPITLGDVNTDEHR
jgi:hypothetical protein